ncbi:PhzF family phenazine biosynthesis protein [Ornithinimicrobium sp. F0845]|uniref:PhzF family phenazine biosynthesis protein n=1 Tax=Ornithinimicrobium sp. F0845 TaxID=2926412 RepID=UPI001FF1BE92|nr:PhzF family phenazine biosynthesis protein [Ornithinimicrobium sp. F0845]MCK0112991.1 PhzF family phenazine biosynthesis protein [Ornithinimicrobium sp. F0845]
MRFSQLDVFAQHPFRGNPLAVVHDAEGLADEELARFANWTNLSETTFLLPPTVPEADYRVRIFTVSEELPFAGHPTLGSARAWLLAGGAPRTEGEVVQQCGAGLVRVRYDGARLAFAAPAFLRSGEVSEADLERIVDALRIRPDQVRHAQWIDNGPGWVGIVLGSAEEALALEPDFAAFGGLDIGVIGPHGPGGPADYEVRAFVPGLGVNEDPVTGSLNAGFGVWMIGAGLAPASFTVRQGTALGRAGDVELHAEDGEVWVGGEAHLRVSGEVIF